MTIALIQWIWIWYRCICTNEVVANEIKPADNLETWSDTPTKCWMGVVDPSVDTSIGVIENSLTAENRAQLTCQSSRHCLRFLGREACLHPGRYGQ